MGRENLYVDWRDQSSQKSRWSHKSYRPHLIALAVLVAAFAATGHAAEQLEIHVRETAGLARRGYPAHGLVTLPRAVASTTKFRLLEQGKPLAAQFRPDGEGPTARWWLDFQTEIRPLEARKLTIEFGEDVPAGPERSSGHRLTETDTHFLVANAPYITWTIPRDLRGLIKSVDFAPSEYLRNDSPGLVMRDRQSKEHVLAGTARVVRQGLMTVGLRFESTRPAESLQNVRSSVDLTFPAPVSWVEVDWTVADPRDELAALGLQLNLNLEPPAGPAATLVDFGATSTIYTALRTGQSAELVAGILKRQNNDPFGPDWEILRTDRGKTTVLASGLKSVDAAPVEGWAHVMDRKICLAIAVADFARSSNDRLRADADGKVTLWREYATPHKGAPKRLRFWLHFVFFPPQASALASPQQMQAPLEVKVVSAGER